MPTIWKTYKLGDFITHKKGFAFKSNLYKEEGCPIIRVTNFTGNSISMDDILFIDNDQKINFKEVEIKEEDIIIATVGSWPNNPSSIVGRVIKVPKVANGALLNQNAVIIYPNQYLDRKFLYYLLKEKNFSNYLVSGAQGSANQASIKLEQIYNYEFLAPDLTTQTQIAQILSSLDDKIELNLQMNQTLEAMAQALFKEWFVDFNFPDFDGKLENGLPKGWRMGRFEELTDIKTGKGLKRTEFKVDGQYPIIGANGELGKTDKYFSDEKLLLTGRVGTLGAIKISYGKKWYSDNVLMMKPYKYFYFSYFNLKLIDMNSLNRGSTQPLVTQTDLKNYLALIPSQEILLFFEKIVSPFFEKIESNKNQIQTLTQTRDALLPKLMSGKVLR